MHKSVYALLVSAFALLLSQGGVVAQNIDYRGIHLVEARGPVDIHLQERDQATIQGLPFAHASLQLKNLPVQGGVFSTAYTEADAGLAASFVSTSQPVLSGFEYVSVAYGSTGSERARLLRRSKQMFPAAGKTMLRVMNAASISTALDVHLGSVGPTPIMPGIEADSVSTFKEVDARATTLLITEPGSLVPVATLTVPLAAGQPFVTLIVTGTSSTTLRVYAFNDMSEGRVPLTALEQASYTDLRVVHARPTVPQNRADSLDIYLGRAASSTDQLVVDSLRYRYASPGFGPMIPDSFRVKFVPVKESPSSPILSTTRELSADTAYVMIYTQFTDLNPVTYLLRRSPIASAPPGLGSSRIRFTNANAFAGPLTAIVTAGLDTIRFDSVGFLRSSQFRDISPSVPLSIALVRPGSTAPIYTGTSSTVVVPSDSYLTIIALGTETEISVDMLNETQSGRQPLATFDGMSSVDVPARVDAALSVAPVPASDMVRIHSDNGRISSVRVFDVLGQVAGTFTSDGSAHRMEIDLTTLSDGQYIVVASIDDGSTATSRLVIRR